MSLLKIGKPVWNKGLKMSDSTRLLMSMARKGKAPWNKGMSDEDKAKYKFGDGFKKKIHQFTMDGTFVQEWSSLTEASTHFSSKASTIFRALNSKSQVSKGFLWRYANSDKPVPINTLSERKRKQIGQYSHNNVFIRSWGSISEASKQCQINPSNVSMACSGKRKSAGGFLWKYMDQECVKALC
jgi:hypothetical protein